ncbi:hypothetical protein C0Q70_11316 [Pomacea canaliculata]|uniref:RING-type domain-containing protein n=1 Tax=Pomacea canaliculata TaxID=400727 RepID=A0A2T7P5L2_POMCA|nr:hypothetical protein C0Q70_11316 [Pomacea canaliculata]
MQTHEATVYVTHVSHTREATATGSKLRSLAAQGGIPCDSVSLTSDSRPQMTGTRIQLDSVHEILTCRKCRHREVDTVLLPCGHLCACSACASDMTQCLSTVRGHENIGDLSFVVKCNKIS